ncbi:DUF58 domain-containing protein [Fuerstiella marisgermanici]|uniref:DUF58 domain-containing protein n=1 Tax=Fuerstiella marisgermanici TaxID=1891926 RepID=A0A1P8WDJ4_9PLAN|nr:DUF58 domain-containing protein [Fuerstiella marisgermanici]APZ92142.1 hypothetical protein Fuma_01747 [Fuerstiella marisgermanici]
MKKKSDRHGLAPSFSLTAGALTQLLAAFACFLGAYVLPLTFPEIRGVSGKLLIILGSIMLVLGIGNIIFGRQLNRVLVRAGKRSRVVIPREGIGYLAIMLTLAVGALMGHRNMPLLVFGMMAGPFILNGWIVYGMLKGITVERRVPRRATVDQYVSVEITVRNRKRLLASHMLEVRDRISGRNLRKSLHDVEGLVAFVRVPPKAARTGRYELRFSDRGRYTIGPARVSSRFPLGIGERGQMIAETSEVIVHPKIGQLLPSWRRQQKELAESSVRVHSRPGLFDDEFHRIREYRSDDNPRSIHWRSTARRGQLMVREHQQNRQSDSLVLLDLPEIKGWPRQASEMAISLAATICVEQTRASSGSSYLLGIASATPMILTSRVPGGFREEALDALAVCKRSAKADLQKLIAEMLTEHTLSDERIVLITPRPAIAEEALASVSREMLSDRIDLVQQTTIVEASVPRLKRTFALPEIETVTVQNDVTTGGAAV